MKKQSLKYLIDFTNYLFLLSLCLLGGISIKASQTLPEIVKSGLDLKRYCRNYKTYNLKKYSAWLAEDQVKKTIASNLQYFLIRESIKNIASLAKKLEVDETDYKRMTKSLVHNSCSENLTMIRPKEIIKQFEQAYHYEAPTAENVDRERLGIVVNRFKQVCSWNGKIDNFRLLSWFLSDHFIYSWLIKKVNQEKKRVLCHDLVCKVVSQDRFTKLHPVAAGSFNWEEDWRSYYCTYFRFVVHDPRKQPPLIKKWIKDFSPHRGIFLADFLSQVTKEKLEGVRGGLFNWDRLLGEFSYFIERDWKNKNEKHLEQKAGHLNHEEPLRLLPLKENSSQVLDDKLVISVLVSAGEVDKNLKIQNKVKANFHIKFPESFFYWLKNQAIPLKVDDIEYGNLKKKLMMYYEKLVNDKVKLFNHAPWSEKLVELLVDETLKQMIYTKFKNPHASISQKWAFVEVNLHFGLFALKDIYNMGESPQAGKKGINFSKIKH